MLPHEQLERVLTWQEERRVTENLTLHYKRVMYLLDPSEASRCAAGHKVLVVESREGRVSIEYKGQVLPARAFVKDARVQQSATADNKVLAAVLVDVQRRQVVRAALQAKRMTLREEDLELKGMGKGGLPTRRGPGRPTIRELALSRIAAECALPFTGSPVDQLVVQTVARFVNIPVECAEPPRKRKARRPPRA